MELIKEKPTCPHCGQIMNIWMEDMFPFAEGPGWELPYLFICFNDECSLYVEGWNTIQLAYGHHASMRCMCDPTTGKCEGVPVFSSMGMRGGIVDDFVPEPEPIVNDAIQISKNELFLCSSRIPFRCRTCDYTGPDTYTVKFHFGLRYTEMILCSECLDMLSEKIKKERT